MDVAWFLGQRIRFIRYLYRDATGPFVERIRLIDEGLPPFDPLHCDSGYPPFELEWGDANDAIQMLGHSCVSMLAGALHVYFEIWERKIGIVMTGEDRQKLFRKKGWLHGYGVMFSEAIDVQFASSGANLDLLEQLVLARNRAQHPGSLTRTTPTHSAKDLKNRRPPFFLSDHEREVLAQVEGGGIDMDSVWMIEPTLHVDMDKLDTVLDEVEHFAAWFDAACFDWIYGPKPVGTKG